MCFIVADFKPNRSQRKVLKAAAHLHRNATSPWATEDQYALFRRYLDARHADGGMADMDVFEFAAMVEETPIKSRVIEYSRPAGPGETGTPLTVVSLTDVFDDGLSMVYSFYDPDFTSYKYRAGSRFALCLSGLLGAWQPQDGL